MHEMRNIAIDNPVAWESVSVSQSLCLFVTRMTVLTYSPNGATLMWLLLHYCSNLVLDVSVSKAL